MDIRSSAGERILIAAHRGVFGGNIPCNTLESFQAALNQGADIIELDISMSRDGELFVFHPGMEPVFLGSPVGICDMNAKQVDSLYLRNTDHTPTQYRVPRLREALELLRGRCYINLDKFWTCPERIAGEVRSLGMQDQVIIKTPASEENFAKVEAVAPDLPYMAIAWDNDNFTDNLLNRSIRYVGVEALFSREDVPIARKEYLLSIREKGLIAWANAIVYNYKAVISAHRTDDISIFKNPDEGWGWLIDRGFNIIQTDWPLALNMYLKK